MASEPAQQTTTNLPIVYVHRPPSFFLPFKPHLEPYFHLVDPLDQSQPPPPQLIQSVQVLLCVGYAQITSQTLTLFPSLQLIVGTSSGLDHVDLKACKQLGVTVTNASVAFASEAADYAVALLIDVLRRISAGDRFVRRGLWSVGDYPLGYKLGGRRIGIVGLGNIGSEVSKRLVAFGCSIAYTSRTKKATFPYPYYMNVHELATNSDVLILCCSLTEETYHIINQDVMQALGQGVIINIGRGSLIDEKELVKALVEGKIGGAGIDVFENEPVVPKELFGLDNVVLSPHRAIAAQEAIEALVQLVIANIKAFFSSEPLQSVVQID